MNMEILNGKWRGICRYDSLPGVPEFKAVKFEMDIHFNGNNFTGTCIDEYTVKYFDEPATISGTFSPNYISFIKKYPALLTSDESLNPLVILEEPSADIHYTGILTRSFFTRRYVLTGEWSLTDIFLDETGKKQFQTNSGTWRLKKTK
jgi:hypothetical protein